jgi:hypothetical protein
VTVRRLTAAGAATAALLGATALPATAAGHTPRPHRHAVVISGVHLNPGHREHRNRLDHRAVDLDGWTLSDRHGHTYTFRHYRLDGGSTVRVHSGHGRDTRTDLFQDRRGSVWDRHGDTAVLRDDRHRFVDALTWGGPH